MAALLAATAFAFVAALLAAAVFLATAVLAAAALVVRFSEDFGVDETARVVFAEVFLAAVFAAAALLTFALGATEAVRPGARVDALFAERAVRTRCVFDAEDFEDLEAVLPRTAPGAWAF